VTSDDHPLVAGNLKNSIDFGTGVLQGSANNDDAFVAKLLP
jgi:hypothetical protein